MDIVIIDPGHGGTAAMGRSSPHGVRGPGGTLEKHVTLELAQQVVRHLGQGAMLTRSSDVNLPLAERAALARRQGARVFLSLHANEGPPGRRGAETYVHPRAVEDSRVLAQAVQQSLARYGSPDRGVREARMEVLRPEHHAPHTAACLLEVDYLSDSEGERGLGAPGSLERLGAAIAQGVRGYLERSSGAPAYGMALPRRYGFRSALAASLVRVGGSANAADATLVSAELDKLPVGMATMERDGTVKLTLRAEDPSGVHGDALLSYPPSHPQYQEILRHVGPLSPGQQRPVRPWPDTHNVA